jgi:5-methylcytosine-specific restriction endonuclease McrA
LKTCRLCLVPKSLDDFYPHASTADKRRHECKSCVKGRESRRHAQADPEAHNATNRAWRSANPEAARAHQRSYYERTRDSRRDIRLEQTRQWAAANPDAVRANGSKHSAKRRARKRDTQIDRVDLAAILDEHGRFCHLCEREIAEDDVLEMDHVVPLSRGGSHTADNIRPSHRRCNRRKYNKLPDELREDS